MTMPGGGGGAGMVANGFSGGTSSSSGQAGAVATAGAGNAQAGSTSVTSAGAGNAGSGNAVAFSWPGAFDAAGAPTPADGHHNVGANCMSSACHGTKIPFVYGGTVYLADATTAAPNVQVGITDGVLTLTTYSAQNGNIWLPSSAGTIDWTKAVIVIRSAKGERTKPATAPRGAACNGAGCHGSTMRIIAP